MQPALQQDLFQRFKRLDQLFCGGFIITAPHHGGAGNKPFGIDEKSDKPVFGLTKPCIRQGVRIFETGKGPGGPANNTGKRRRNRIGRRLGLK